MFNDYTGWAIVITVAHYFPKHEEEKYVAFGHSKQAMFNWLEIEKGNIIEAIIYYVVDGIAEETYKEI